MGLRHTAAQGRGLRTPHTLDIEDRALRYLRLKLGAAAAEQALRAYRDRHRSSMMARASQAFATISRRAYTGLAAQPEKDGEILIALAAEHLAASTRANWLSNRVFDSYDDIIHAACDAWNRLVAQLKIITSIGIANGLISVNYEGRWYQSSWRSRVALGP